MILFPPPIVFRRCHSPWIFGILALFGCSDSAGSQPSVGMGGNQSAASGGSSTASGGFGTGTGGASTTAIMGGLTGAGGATNNGGASIGIGGATFIGPGGSFGGSSGGQSGGTTAKGGSAGATVSVTGGSTASGGRSGAATGGAASGGSGVAGGGGTAGAVTAPTFTEIYNTIITKSCGGTNCHLKKPTPRDYDFSTKSAAYASWLGDVFPGYGMDSPLFQVLNLGIMPMNAPSLSVDELYMVLNWIDAGALNN